MKATLRTQFERVNRLALMQLGHFRRSTPTGGLEVIAHIMPLDLYIIKTALLALLRTRANKNWLEDQSISSAPCESYIKQYMDLLTSMSLDQLRLDKTADTPLASEGYQVSEERRHILHRRIRRDGARRQRICNVRGHQTGHPDLFTLDLTTAHFAEVYAIQKVAPTPTRGEKP